MTLLSDLQSLDLSAIVNARASIQVTVNGAELKSILDGGAVQTALGDLGTALQSLRGAFDDAAGLVRPLADALGDLSGVARVDGLPVAQYVDAVREGATIVSSLFQGLDGDPASFGKIFGMSLGDTLSQAKDVLDSYSIAGLADLGEFRNLVNAVERGVPRDVAGFADLATRVLNPFPASGLRALRGHLDTIFRGAAAIDLPRTRTSGLVLALNAVTTAAAAGNAPALAQTLQNLNRVRMSTVDSIGRDLLDAVGHIDALHVDRLLAPLETASRTLRVAEDGVLDFLASWRDEIAEARLLVEGMDGAQLTAKLPPLLQGIEEFARTQIADPVDEQVRLLETWVRNLLSHLPLQPLRAKLSEYIHQIAVAIAQADLDRYARLVHEQLDPIQSAIDSVNLGDTMRAALQRAQETIDAALDAITGALESIKVAVEALAVQAEGILNRAADTLAEFRQSIDQLVAGIESLGIEQATRQVLDAIGALRAKAEDLLAKATLPESLRPLIDQLIQGLEEADLEVVFQPLRDITRQFTLPDSVRDPLLNGLQSVREALQNLVPAQLIAAIEREIEEALDRLRRFDPAQLLSGISDYIDDTVSALTKLDPAPLLNEIRRPFQVLLDAVDAANPFTLLAPVIEVYDSLLGQVPLPTPASAVERTTGVIGAAGDSMARSAVAPLGKLAPAGEEAAPAGTAPPAIPEVKVRPGDVIRLFGYLPNKLRETLRGLEAGPAGDALAAVDALAGGLARDLRGLQSALWAIEARLDEAVDEMLAPVAQAQLEAQLAIQTSPGTIDVDVSLAAVAATGPGPLRHDLGEQVALARGRAHGVADATGGDTGAALERTALALERSQLASLTGSLDAFLEALDPEPLAADIDALVEAALAKAPALLAQIGGEVTVALQKLRALLAQYNPGAQAQKFLAVLAVVREQLEVLDPRRLAAELGEVHLEIRRALAAYDPAAFATDVAAVVAAITAKLKALNPAALLGDLAFLGPTLDRIQQAVPAEALNNVGASLAEVGNRLAGIDPTKLLEAVEGIKDRIEAEIEIAIARIATEITALLKSLQYAASNASASVSLSIG